jgi:hypothetical protein
MLLLPLQFLILLSVQVCNNSARNPPVVSVVKGGLFLYLFIKTVQPIYIFLVFTHAVRMVLILSRGLFFTVLFLSMCMYFIVGEKSYNYNIKAKYNTCTLNYISTYYLLLIYSSLHVST